VQRDIVTELYVGGGWTNVTNDVKTGDPIHIARGRRNESGDADPSTCGLTINNRSGNYSPRNPVGAYYGSIGRNTPIRLALRTAKDSYARTVSNGWGTADVGGAWTTSGGSASDYNVGSGVGKLKLTTTNVARTALLGPTVMDREVLVKINVPAVATGASLIAGVLLRYASGSDHYRMQLEFPTAGNVKIAVYNVTTLLGTVVTTSLNYAANSQFWLRAHAEANQLRGRVWADGTPEPNTWNIDQFDLHYQVGPVGLFALALTGNTNSNPEFSFASFEVRSNRFHGEVSSWPARWSINGTDVYVPVEAAGLLRRLGQGASPLHSALRRSVPNLGAQLVAYWPCEDGKKATEVASGLGGPSGLFYFSGPADFASFSDFDCSDPLPIMHNTRWDGNVPFYVSTGQIQVRFLLHIPDNGTGDATVLAHVWTNGTAALWEISYFSGGGLAIKVYDGSSSTAIYTSGIGTFNANGKLLRVSLEMTESGGNVNWTLATLEVGQTIGGTISGTVTGRTVSSARQVIICPHLNQDQVAIGHVTVESAVTSLFDLFLQLNAYSGETAIIRMQRLCVEEGVPLGLHELDSTITSPAMGAQKPDTLVNLLRECEAVDMCTLYESRNTLSLMYRRRSSLYNQPARVALTYGQLSPPFEPTDDDQQTRNDVTVKRVDGVDANAVLASGPLSVQLPPNGVGKYDTSVTLNVASDSQVPDSAAWLLHLGTVNEPRYPTATVNLLATTVTADPAAAPGILDLSVDDRLTVSGLPVWLPPGTVSLLARGHAETLGQFEHTITPNCAPESPYQVVKLDTSLLDADISTLASGVTSSGTSLSVATPSGTLWQTGSVSIPITIGGEDVTVTNISGSSSPQTFTVTRSVNGIVKAHSSGESVALTHPAVLAL